MVPESRTVLGVYMKGEDGMSQMDQTLIAYCGAYCGVCEWKERTGCKGCKACAGKPFWGECDKAKCCIQRGHDHCGQCLELPCEMLKELFDDPEHGDQGVRLRNLLNWKDGKFMFEKLGNAAQENAKKL